jgi:hypothetical protein
MEFYAFSRPSVSPRKEKKKPGGNYEKANETQTPDRPHHLVHKWKIDVSFSSKSTTTTTKSNKMRKKK